MNLQRGIGRLLVLCVLVFLPLSLSLNMHRASAANSAITIGLIVAQTGVGASTGGFKINGANLAISQINATGGINGHPLNLVIVDDQTTNAGTVSAFQRLMSQGNIAALVGPIRSTEVQAVAPYVERQGIPMMIGGTAPALTHSGDPWVFRTRPNDSYSAQALAAFVVNTLHLRKIAVAHSTDAFGVGGETALLAALKAVGVTPVTDQGYNNHDTDLTPQVLAIKKSGANALISYVTYDEDGILLGRQMHQYGVKLVWAGSPSLTDVNSRRLGGSLLNDTYGVSDLAVGQNAESVAVNKVYMAKYHVNLDIYSAYVYDGIQILAMAMRHVGTSPSAIRSYILSINNYHGAEGTYNFDKNGDGLHQYTIVRNVGGAIKIIKVVVFPKPH